MGQSLSISTKQTYRNGNLSEICRHLAEEIDQNLIDFYFRRQSARVFLYKKRYTTIYSVSAPYTATPIDYFQFMFISGTCNTLCLSFHEKDTSLSKLITNHENYGIIAGVKFHY